MCEGRPLPEVCVCVSSRLSRFCCGVHVRLWHEAPLWLFIHGMVGNGYCRQEFEIAEAGCGRPSLTLTQPNPSRRVDPCPCMT
jgi:hypothetical protein